MQTANSATIAAATNAAAASSLRNSSILFFRINTSSAYAKWLFMISSYFITLLTLLLLPRCCHAVGYSYTRFVGPVSGPEQKVLVHDHLSGGTRVDFIAKPEYQFAYGVEDSKTRVLQNRKEQRDGDAVKGVYSVVEPDGTLRVVKYTADNVHGFQAEVITNGLATIHGHNGVNAMGGNAGGNQNTFPKWNVQPGSRQQQQQHEVQHPDDYDSDGDRESVGRYKVHEPSDESNSGDDEAEEDDGEYAEEEKNTDDYSNSEEAYEDPSSHEQEAVNYEEESSDEYY